MKLNGKVAVVTGSSRGLGAYIARRFANEGAKVAIVAKERIDKANTVVDEIRKTLRFYMKKRCEFSSKGFLLDCIRIFSEVRSD